jgi:hypothetical protein
LCRDPLAGEQGEDDRRGEGIVVRDALVELTRRVVRWLACGEIANKHASQFLWSCIFFSMLSFMFGMAVSGYVWISTDFMRGFGVVFSSAMTAVAIYPVHRDAKRLADAIASSHGTSVQRDQGNR